MNLSETIKQLRKDKGLTQAELAKRSGATQSKISMIEKGGGARFATAVRILEALGYKLVVTFKSQTEGGQNVTNN